MNWTKHKKIVQRNELVISLSQDQCLLIDKNAKAARIAKVGFYRDQKAPRHWFFGTWINEVQEYHDVRTTRAIEVPDDGKFGSRWKDTWREELRLTSHAVAEGDFI